MKRILISVVLLFSVIFLVNCTNPLPTLILLSPDSKVAHIPTFTLTVTGTDFISDSKIVFNNVEKITTYVSSTELTCEINPEDIPTGGINMQVLVRTPSPGGGDSNTLNFNVLSNFTFSSPVNVSNNTGVSEAPAIAVNSTGHLNCVWYDDTPGNREILFKRSTDNGLTWSPTRNISNSSGMSRFPDIAIDSSDTLHVVWHDYLNAGNSNIFFSRSSNGGSSWSTRLIIHNTLENARQADIVVDSADNLNCVWHSGSDVTLFQRDIYFSRSTNGGTNWSPPVILSDNLNDSQKPSIAVDSSDNLNCVWFYLTDIILSEILFKKSHNNGVTWGPPIAVNISNTFNDNSYSPVIAIDCYDRLFVGWSDESLGNYEILFSRSTDNGNTWSAFTNISNNVGASYSPAIAVDSAGNLNCVWWDDTSGKREIYFSRSTDEGGSWSPIVIISTPSGDSWNPDIAVDIDGNVHCVWYDDYTRNLEIFYSGTVQ